MKKLIGMLLVCSVVFSCCFLSGCGDTKLSEDSRQNPEDTSQNTWELDMDKPWYFTPACGEEEDLDGYDIEISLDVTTYSHTPDSLICNVVNKTGKPYMLGAVLLEKLYEHVYYPYHEEMPSAWVRLPFMMNPRWSIGDNSLIGWKIELSKYMKEDFEFTPGRYRLVIFAGDGSHYAYFEITG